MSEGSAYDVIIHPFVTEKTMAAMERENKLEFLVRRDASKPAIRKAIEVLFDAKVDSVNIKIGRDGQKHAIVKFGEGTKAEDVGTRIGIF
ncbi:MAG TPA: 50S ribosomal protein L23 [Candidatus Thermoplasmatota archaeon]|nr:50S ribosomal protein L23 [Candidatus Thermoplasmatota archaeon]